MANSIDIGDKKQKNISYVPGRGRKNKENFFFCSRVRVRDDGEERVKESWRWPAPVLLSAR